MSHGFENVPALPHSFRGGLAFNQRTVFSATETLLGQSEAGEHLVGTPLRFVELTNLLLLLESLAMSNALYVDGTLPANDIAVLKNSLWRVGAQSGVSVDVEFVRPAVDTLPLMFKESAEAAALIIDRDLNQFDPASERPVPGNIDKFVETLRLSQSDQHGGHAADFAQRTATDVSEDRESFRGSKCVAGLLLANPDPIPVARRASERLDAADEETRRRLISLLINRFRINYVNSIAGVRQAAYLADSSIEDLKAAQVLLFARYLASKISITESAQLSAATMAVFDQSLSSVPLGVAILLNARGRTPLALLDEAMAVRELKFGLSAARATPQVRYLHQFSSDEFASFQDYLFKDKWADLLNNAERGTFARSDLREVRIPSAIGGIVGAALGALTDGVAGAAAGSLVGSLVQHLGETIAGRIGSGGAVHVDQYRRLAAYMALASKNDRFVTPFREKVELIFSRPLVAS